METVGLVGVGKIGLPISENLTQFGIRAPWMAQRRFLPAQGTVPALQHYFDMIGEFADSVGVATPMLDRAVELYEKFVELGLGEKDGAAMVDVVSALPRAKARNEHERRST
jgi:3-hydroxyisobutyrate dehydrogenase-like beta-hydroxyacid dehydrogenase